MSASNIYFNDEQVVGLDHVPRKKKGTAPLIFNGETLMEGIECLTSNVELKSDNPIPRKKRSLPIDEVQSDGVITATQTSAIGLTIENSHPLYPTSTYIRLISEVPFVLKFNTHEMGLRAQRPLVKRSRSISAAAATYRELDNSDSDDYIMTEQEEHQLQMKRLKRKSKKSSTKSPGVSKLTISPSKDKADHLSLPAKSYSSTIANIENDATLSNLHIPVIDNIESPPPGQLSTLWYSLECFNYVWVMEKICGWKTRSVYSTTQHNVDIIGKESQSDKQSDEEGQHPSTIMDSTLDLNTAIKIQQAVLQSYEFATDPNRRIEVSRINPTQCPLIRSIAVAAKLLSHPLPSGYDTTATSREREEVLLVKWRGRSHYHCSWERASDIERLDPSTNNTARNKIRRFYQQQETTFGARWKQLLEEERNTAARIHHGGTDVMLTVETLDGTSSSGEQVEEFFSPQCLMVERVLGCDENEMDMQVLAKQRAINMYREQIEELQKEERDERAGSALIGPDGTISKLASLASNDWEVPYDPEDNVRYVVKWKGLPYAEVTWEYWRDIKYDYVDEVEDFWYRQIAPDLEYAKECFNRPHPHIKEFKKVQESRLYGVSNKKRPVAPVEVNNEEYKNKISNTVQQSESGFRLRSYQLEGLNWLLFNWWNRRSCILADEMGLGKTIQSAAFLQELQSQPAAQVRGPFLIVAPLSLIDQWQSELRSWAPDMNVILYHGSADAREFLVKQEFYFSDQFVPKADASKLKKYQVTKFHVLITTYEVVLKDITVLSKISWKTLIVDEAHRLKNYKARLFMELSTVPREHCVLLTGTPIANATEELWALLHFANPGVFTDRDDFLAKFGEMTDARQVEELHALLKPYLLRRVKEDVEKSLPNKEETILEVSLTPIQKTFYKAIYERNTSFLFKGAKANNTPSLMNVMMELRKCCNHPFLIKGAEDRILHEAASKARSDEKNSGSVIAVDPSKIYADQLVKSSGKMVLMEKLLHKLFVGGHKVLVFSQMVRVLDLLEDLLRIKSYRYERLDGSTSSSSRLHAVERFKKKECNRFVMLLSTRAGGLGLNLTVADIVIIFDSDWNPQNDMQAMARAHRIGQTRAVKVYRFLTAKTYEMHMFHSASLKLGLERAVMSQSRELSEDNEEGPKGSKKGNREAQAKEIDQLLKKGAYDIFRDDDDKEAEKFMETDIDQLLEHSSKTVSYGASATTSLGSGLGSFSKASFVASTDDGAKDVDLDDPDFWSKAVGLDSPPEEVSDLIAVMIDDGVKRQRKQVEQYDPYAESSLAEQMKKDQLELEKMLEEEENERLAAEKNGKTKKSKESKGKPIRDALVSHGETRRTTGNDSFIALSKVGARNTKDIKPKNGKSKKRALALRRAENEDPVIEQLKQAWEIPQRNRASAAAIRFGFGRFCKIRNESNLSSLPIQDIEIFVRSYFYQLSLQVAVTLLSKLCTGLDPERLRTLVRVWMGLTCQQEVDWICDALQEVMKLHLEVENNRTFLRIPSVLNESIYVEDLRHGAGLRALRRVGVLARLNDIVEECVDEVFQFIGQEELGKRGCIYKELSMLDLDQKSRFITIEELMLRVGNKLPKLMPKYPTLWWDRTCDIALVVGSFVHGLSNYEAMRRDKHMPFGEKISKFCKRDISCKLAEQRFRASAEATRCVFESALEAGRIKAELEVQAAVAAAAKAALQREEDAALLRKGGAEAEGAVRNMPETQVDDAFEFDGTDTHFVTLPRIHQNIQDAARRFKFSNDADGSTQDDSEANKWDQEFDAPGGRGQTSKVREHYFLPLPDSRILDHRLMRLIHAIESSSIEYKPEINDTVLWGRSNDVTVNLQVRQSTLSHFYDDAMDVISEYSGIGLSAIQCGISHRTLNDGSDFSFGSASSQISQLAYGTDAPRYLRALCVPMNVTRLAISGLLYSDFSTVKTFMISERLRYFGKEDNKADQGDDDNALTSTISLSTFTDESWMHSSSRPTILAPIDPIEIIADEFRSNAKLRACVCSAVGFLGFPLTSTTERNKSRNDLHTYIFDGNETPDVGLFDIDKFREAVTNLDPSVDLPNNKMLTEYVEMILLPHCLRLCVYGNGPCTRNARGSHGDYETAFGISIHPEPSQPYQSPLPDPCLRVQEHSIEAIGFANAILRRVRLLRSCVHICRDESEIKFDTIVCKAKSKIMGQSLDEMPLWWCPWKHDVALLLHVAMYGVFSILHNDRSDHLVFSTNAIVSFLRTNIISNPKLFPGSEYFQNNNNNNNNEIDMWSYQYGEVKSFPTLRQLERRLGLFCSELTSDLQHDDSECRFDYIPMYDHGGWPRK